MVTGNISPSESIVSINIKHDFGLVEIESKEASLDNRSRMQATFGSFIKTKRLVGIIPYQTIHHISSRLTNLVSEILRALKTKNHEASIVP